MGAQSNTALFDRHQAVSTPTFIFATRIWREASKALLGKDVSRRRSRGSRRLRDLDRWSHQAEAALCEERLISRR